jgi:hypothetical protein
LELKFFGKDADKGSQARQPAEDQARKGTNGGYDGKKHWNEIN